MAWEAADLEGAAVEDHEVCNICDLDRRYDLYFYWADDVLLGLTHPKKAEKAVVLSARYKVCV